MKVGIQLYTLRDYCKTPEDIYNTLKRVADIGYTCVQMSGIGKIISILQPIVVGLIIAYLVNPMTNFFTKHINRLLKKMTKKDKDFPKLKKN